MAMVKPTPVQAEALRRTFTAGSEADWTVPVYNLPDRTLDLMITRQWITRPDVDTIRCAPEGAYILGQFGIGDAIRAVDLLRVDPAAQRLIGLCQRAETVGIVARPSMESGTVTIDAETFGTLVEALARARAWGVSAAA